jgi:uncharacterized integral membrane protein
VSHRQDAKEAVSVLPVPEVSRSWHEARRLVYIIIIFLLLLLLLLIFISRHYYITITLAAEVFF